MLTNSKKSIAKALSLILNLSSELVVVAILLESIQFNLPLLKNSRSLAFGTIFLLFISALISGRKKLVKHLGTKFTLLILLFLLGSSLSLFFNPLPTDNRPLIYLFLGVVGFTSLAILKIDRKKLIKAITLAVLLIGTISLTSLLVFDFGQKIIYLLFHEVVADYVLYNYLRGRIFPVGLLFISVLVPLVIVGDRKTTRAWRVIAYISASFGVIAVVLSNYRSHLLTILVGFILLFKIFKKEINFNRFAPFLIGLLIGALFLSSAILKVNLLNRIIFQDETDQTSLSTRWYYMKSSWQMFRQSPLVGIGLGNFSELVPEIANSFKANPYTKDPQWGAPSDIVLAGHPHNQLLLVLSETGLFGFVPYLLLVCLFLKSDIEKIRKNRYDIYQKGLALSSWLFLIGGTFDALPINAQVYFLLVRGVLAANDEN